MSERRTELFTSAIESDLDLYQSGSPAVNYAIGRLRTDVLNKYVGRDCSGLEGSVSLADAERACWESLKASNKRCGAVNATLDLIFAYNPQVERVMKMAREYLHMWLDGPYERTICGEPLILHGLDPLDLAHGLGTGPGASLGSEDTSFFHKMVRGRGSYYEGKEVAAQLFKGLLPLTSTLWARVERGRSLERARVYPGSRFGTVPKNLKKRRGIATEAVYPMALQLAIGKCASNRLRFFTGIDVHDQTLNQQLARSASVGDHLATIDMSEASDSRALEVDRYLLPSDWFNWMKVARSEKIVFRDEVVELEMTSTMGNGFTFAIMTTVFTAILYAVYDELQIPVMRPGGRYEANLAVYGDDLIVAKEAVPLVFDVLTRIGYKINEGKSYTEGPFRESCGADWYCGYPVRPVYVEEFDTQAGVLTTLNLLVAWSAFHTVPLPRTVGVLRSWLDDPPLVPLASGFDAGIQVPHALFANVRPPAPFPIKRKLGTSMVLYRHLEAKPTSYLISEKLVDKKGYVKPEMDEGYLLSVLHGCVKRGRVSVRSVDLAWRDRWAGTSFWDAIPLVRKRSDRSPDGSLWGITYPQLYEHWTVFVTEFYSGILSP